MAAKQLRQGDLLFVQMDSLKPMAKDTQAKDGIILTGEATGHAHRIPVGMVQQGKAKVYFMGEPKRIEGLDFPAFAIVATKTAVPVVHEDHKTIVLDKGTWGVIRQREYSPQELRVVRD